PDGGLYIETVPKHGYRFAAAVTQTSDVGQVESQGSPESGTKASTPASVFSPFENDIDSPRTARVETSVGDAVISQGRRSTGSRRKLLSTRALLAIGSVLVVATAALLLIVLKPGSNQVRIRPRQLAILPFRNLKPDKETDFLGFSLADATITRLSDIGSIVVRPSSFVEKYRSKEVDPKHAAADLNVDTLLTGTYLREGSTFRLTIQLIDVKTDKILLVLPIEARYDRLATVQDQVTQSIVDKLQLKLTYAEVQQLGQKGTENAAAYDYFLHGIDLYSRDEFLPAYPMLEKAVEADPNFALAWAHLGRAYNAVASFNLRGRNYHVKAQAAYEQALSLNPDLSEVSIYMANLFTDTNRVDHAVPLLRKLLASHPKLAEAHWELGYAYRQAGMLAESIEECSKAREIDPTVKINSSAFNSYLYTGQYEKFLGSLPLGEPSPFIVFYRGFANYYLQNMQQAALDFDRAYEIEPQLYTRIGKAFSYAIKNERRTGLEILGDVDREIQQRGVGDAEGAYKIAQAYAVLGDTQSALRVLARSVDQGFFCYDYIRSDPLLEKIRGEAEYGRILEVARTRHDSFARDFF
ncbi:MAG TPA: tetratricopeptide repeat protein, partial [Blastocatellia bacterium]|nr:tetratricopeptide repeat protein [Blastocatellia bacterium]